MILALGFLALLFNRNPRKELEIKSVVFIYKDNHLFAEIELKEKFQINNELICKILIPPSSINNCQFLIEIHEFPQENTTYILYLPRKVKMSKKGFGFILETSPEIKTKKRSQITGAAPDVGGC